MTQFAAEDLDAHRDSIKKSLDEITNDIAIQVRDARLGSIPIYLTVPASGDAVAPIATPLDDMPDGVWDRVMEIVCRVIKQQISSGKLHSRALTCAAINTAMTSANVTAE
jgi:hypothetical protein